MKTGYALSLAGPNWFGGPKAGTSPHYIVDPGTIVQDVPDFNRAWHVGPNGNPFTIGIEQAGYSYFTRADWTTPDALSQLGHLADLMRFLSEKHGIPKKWATDAEIVAAARTGASPVGWCRHQDITRLLHGTTHTDPGDAYPKDLLMSAVINGVPVPPPAPPKKVVGMFELFLVVGDTSHPGVIVLIGPGRVGWVHDDISLSKLKSFKGCLNDRTADGKDIVLSQINVQQLDDIGPTIDGDYTTFGALFPAAPPAPPA